MLEGRLVLEGGSELTREQITEAYFGLGGGSDGMTWVNAILQGILLGGYYALLACGLALMFGRDADHQPRARRHRACSART